LDGKPWTSYGGAQLPSAWNAASSSSTPRESDETQRPKGKRGRKEDPPSDASAAHDAPAGQAKDEDDAAAHDAPAGQAKDEDDDGIELIVPKKAKQADDYLDDDDESGAVSQKKDRSGIVEMVCVESQDQRPHKKKKKSSKKEAKRDSASWAVKRDIDSW
jgi:hypothetical protein